MAMTDTTTLAIIKSNNQQGVEAEIRRTQFSRKHITLYYTGAEWQIKDHTEATPAFAALSSQSAYEPPFEIRGVNLDHSTDTKQIIEYDTKFNSVSFYEIAERLNTNQIHPVSPTKVHLAGSATTATLIHLHG
jgi:hypothetical protein